MHTAKLPNLTPHQISGYTVSPKVHTSALSYLHTTVHNHLLFFQIPEYCHSLDEPDVLDNAFELIFAFDEIVALGYRENVNLAQIRTFTEMDSHEEKVYEAMRRVGFSVSPSLSLSLPLFP